MAPNGISEQDVLMHLMLYTTSEPYRQAKIPYSSSNNAKSAVAGPSRQRKRSVAGTSTRTLIPTQAPAQITPAGDIPLSISSPTLPAEQLSSPTPTTPQRVRSSWAHITPLSVAAALKNSTLAQAFKSRFGRADIPQDEFGKENEGKRDLEEEEVDELATPRRGWFGGGS
jgi:hypothetical protein